MDMTQPNIMQMSPPLETMWMQLRSWHTQRWYFYLQRFAKVSQWESNLYTDHGYSTSLLVNPGLINQIRYSGAKMNLWRSQPCWRPDCEKWANTNVLGSRTIVLPQFQDTVWLDYARNETKQQNKPIREATPKLLTMTTQDRTCGLSFVPRLWIPPPAV